MVPLMLLGLGWSLFQSPNLSGMFNAVAPRYVGAVSGLSLDFGEYRQRDGRRRRQCAVSALAQLSSA